MKTEIYENKAAFEARSDKKINGVDQDFADNNPGWDEECDNEGCWECGRCEGCRQCEGCDACKDCLLCRACASCLRCLKCVACESCVECVGHVCVVTVRERAKIARKSGLLRRLSAIGQNFRKAHVTTWSGLCRIGRGVRKCVSKIWTVISWPFRKVGKLFRRSRPQPTPTTTDATTA